MQVHDEELQWSAVYFASIYKQMSSKNSKKNSLEGVNSSPVWIKTDSSLE